ncbi:MAG TPA: Glu-tRNA(Gln) amidotransferase subunit GatD [Thermoplasmata archaeon]|nr:Glu-tRNA(Gln) amidotransferase subunit GatD [Thermoplasmata archaeon]
MGDPGSGADPWETLRTLAAGAEIGLTKKDGTHVRGTLVPSHELSGERVVQIKLASGYNVGVRVAIDDRVEVFNNPPTPPAAHPGEERSRAQEASAPPDAVALLTTGGTIASRVDYRTGGVRPVKDESEILRFYPDLARDGPVRVIPVFDRLSEEIVPADWLELADRVAESFREGARGVVVAHGTDTLAHTASALSFALPRLPGPVVVVGAQRSPDRPSSDGHSNLLAAAQVARFSDLGEVVVVMHEGLSDDSFAIHRATRVRKMHSSRRDAFQSRGSPPLGTVTGGQVRLTSPVRGRQPGSVAVDRRIDLNGGLLWVYPGLTPDRALRFVEGLRGVVLAGTGLGHVSTAHLPWIRRAVADGKFVGMTTQCLAGSSDPYVYSTGRELLRSGVTYLGDLLPETGYVKLLFALGRSTTPDGVAREMRADWAGETEPRRMVENAP